MKKFTLLTMLVAMFSMTAFAQAQQLKASPRSVKKQATKALSLKSMKQSKMTRRAASDFPIITEAPEGTKKVYKRSGDDYYVSSDGYLYQGTQSGSMTIVFAANNEVYMKDPLCTLPTDAYVKGTLSNDGATITIPLGQNLAYDEDYDAAIALYVATISGNNVVIDDNATEITYTISGNTITMNNTSETNFLSAFWTDDKSWSGYGEWNTVLTEYVQNLTPVAAPTDITLTEMPLAGVFYADIEDEVGTELSTTVKVGFKDSEVYIQGLIHQLPEAWLKGTMAGSDVVFPVTYMGELNGEHVYTSGFDNNTAPFYMVYDQEMGSLELNGYILLTPDELTLSLDNLLGYYTGLFIGTHREAITPPAELAVAVMPFSTFYYDGEEAQNISGSANVGEDGQGNVYIQGLIDLLPEGWLKGTFNEDRTTLTIPTGQYVGYSAYGSVFVVGGSLEDEESETPIDIVFSYNAAKNVYELQNVLYVNGKKDSFSFYSILYNLVIGNASDATWVAANQGYSNGQEITEITIADGVTGAVSKGEGNTTPKYYNTGEALRLYASNTLTINSQKAIAKIDFTFDTNNGSKMPAFEVNTGEFDASEDGTIGVWEGEANNIVFSVPSSIGQQTRIKEIKITFVAGETGIQSVTTTKRMENNAIYNLAGQRLQQLQKGLNIVNGKKVVVK